MADVTLLRMPFQLAAAISLVVCATALVVPAAVLPQPGHQPGPVPGPGPAPGPIAANAPGPIATQPSSCPDIEVIFARGTDDTPGLGTPGSAFVNALRPLVGGQTVSSYAVNYPASYDFLAAADGAYAAENRIQLMSTQCPST